MTNTHQSLRFALVAAGLMVAAPSFASTVTSLCGGDKDHQEEKSKSENNKKEKEKEPKKPTNPA